MAVCAWLCMHSCISLVIGKGTKAVEFLTSINGCQKLQENHDWLHSILAPTSELDQRLCFHPIKFVWSLDLHKPCLEGMIRLPPKRWFTFGYKVQGHDPGHIVIFGEQMGVFPWTSGGNYQQCRKTSTLVITCKTIREVTLLWALALNMAWKCADPIICFFMFSIGCSEEIIN